ncbi:C-terminal binding protein [Haloarcula amylolytica]|uniref:C-terminal binding protein n=1 Tax=Haloarcula amylolytica TaxID=396317 RepID=UPI003C78711A
MEYTIVLCDNKTVNRTDQVDILEAGGATVETLDEKTEEAVAQAVRGAHGIVVDAATPVTKRVIEGSKTLRVVGRAGIGVDNIDVEAAIDHDVTVVNVPDYSLDEVSNHALALLLACVRNVPQYDRAVKTGTWDWRTGQPLNRLSDGTLGLAGFGGIARRLATKLQSFGVDVIATDPYVDAATMRDYDVKKVSFDELIERVEYLSIHVPLYEKTRHMFSTAEFKRLSEECILINTSRGSVIDEAALREALETGQIARVGLDVLELEPPAVDNPLLYRDDVIVTPHAAWYSEESQEDLSKGVAEAVTAVLRGNSSYRVVNPETPWV